MTPIEPREAQPLLDDAGVVATDVQCLRCGYNLRGLRGDGLCPECAAPVGRSTQGDFLRFADPGWVRRLARGSRLIVNALTTLVATGMLVGLGMALVIFWGLSNPLLSMGALILAVIVALCGFVALYAGVWSITSPDPRRIGRDEQVTARKLVRFAVLVGLLSLGVSLPLEFVNLPPDVAALMLVFDTVIAVIGVVGAVAYYYYVRALCERIPQPDLMRRSRRLGIAIGWIQGLAVAASLAEDVGTRWVGFTPPTATVTATATGPAAPGAPVIDVGDGDEDQSTPSAAVATSAAPGAPVAGPPLAGGVVMAAGCFFLLVAVAALVWLLLAVRFQTRVTVEFAAQAALAEAAWASSAPRSPS